MKNIKNSTKQTHGRHYRSFKLTPMKLSFIVLISAFMAWIVFATYAATGDFNLSTNTKTVTQGSDVYVTLSSTTDSGVTVAHAVVNYDSTKLSYGGADYTGSPISNDVPESTSSPGSVTISRYNVANYPKGTVFIAKLRFTAKTSGGNTNISVLARPSSKLFTEASNGDVVSVGAKTLTLSLVPPQVPASPTQPTVSPNPATPTQQPVQSVTRPTPTQTPAPTTPPQSSNTTTLVPDATTPAPEVYYPQTSIPKPGTSYVSTKPSLFARLSKLLKVIIPIVVISGITGGAVWFVMSRTNHNSMHGFTGAMHSSPTPGTVTSVTPPSNNGSSPNNYVNKPSVGSNNINDNTPKTFSGL